jgi:myosin heavy subunit
MSGGEVETALALDQTIKRFRFQYEKFYRQLRGSMDREKRVLAQLSDVKAQMVDNAQRLELALKARKHDESVIRTLRSELEVALQQANSSKSREAHAMSLVKQLRQEVKALTKYAHQTFSESTKKQVSESSQYQHQQSHHQTQQHQHHSNPAESTIDLMPTFMEWKNANHITHDHHRDHGNPDHLKAIVERRKEHLRSPMERAHQRRHNLPPPINSRKKGMIRL